jgi:hypothetical protein
LAKDILDKALSIRSDNSKYTTTNIIIPSFAGVLADRFYRLYPQAQNFIDKIKNYFQHNVYIILYVRDCEEITKASSSSSCKFDVILSLDKRDVILAELNETHRPIGVLRKFLAQNMPRALSGPYVLVTNAMNPQNNREYDIVKDVRRYYTFKKGSIEQQVNYDALFEDIAESVNAFGK